MLTPPPARQLTMANQPVDSCSSHRLHHLILAPLLLPLRLLLLKLCLRWLLQGRYTRHAPSTLTSPTRPWITVLLPIGTLQTMYLSLLLEWLKQLGWWLLQQRLLSHLLLFDLHILPWHLPNAPCDALYDC
jgi:hypothetical protein